jgi:hypothetical protein
MREFHVSQPLGTRIIAVVACGGFVVFAFTSLAVAIAHHQDVSGAPIAIGMAVFAGALGYRLASLSCRAQGSELVIHNYWRTQRVALAQIDGLDIGRASAGNLLTVRVLTNGKTIPIDVMGITRGFLGRKRGVVMDRLERRRQELATWLSQH